MPKNTSSSCCKALIPAVATAVGKNRLNDVESNSTLRAGEESSH
jgi:hypothetical protein